MKMRCLSISLRQALLLSPLIFAGIGVSTPAATITTCDESGLRAAVDVGGTATFACDGTITLSSTLMVTNNVVLDGRGHNVTISGGGSVRVFLIGTEGSLSLNHLTVAEGYNTNGGGIYNQGTLTLVDCVLSNNHAVRVAGIAGTNGAAGVDDPSRPTAGNPGDNGMSGASSCGGAILNTGIFNARSTLFIRNSADGGAGGNGGDGGRGGGSFDAQGRCWGSKVGGNGGNGGGGGMAFGGALYNAGTAYLTQAEFASNHVRGGTGGDGGASGGECSTFPPRAIPGNAGLGGETHGGAIYNRGLLYLTESSVAQNQSIGGTGGVGGGEPGGGNPQDGAPGATGHGGGIVNCGTNILVNVTLGLNSAVGGNAGLGGLLWEPYRGYCGNGGNGKGGGVLNLGYLWATNCTIWNNSSIGGVSTNTGNPHLSGRIGMGIAATLDTSSGELFLANSIVGSLGSSSNCMGFIWDEGYNLCSDGSYPFSSPGSANNVDPKLAPLAYNGGSTRTFDLLNGSPAREAGNPSEYPETDQRGISRPQGLRSDIGALEQINLSIQKVVNGLELTYYGKPNTTCILQQSTQFPNWEDAKTKVADQNGLVVFTVANPLPPTNLFFRIKLGP